MQRRVLVRGDRERARGRRELLRGCPEIAGLRAPSRWTLLPIAGLVTAQFGAAWLVRAAPWWQIVAIAWAVGAALAFGLLVMLTILPMQMLSGGSTPFESMPLFVQRVMQVAPTTHFVELSQAILYRGAGLETVWQPFLALALIGTVLFFLSLARFRKTIGQMA